jgi:hypothetical protein
MKKKNDMYIFFAHQFNFFLFYQGSMKARPV